MKRLGRDCILGKRGGRKTRPRSFRAAPPQKRKQPPCVTKSGNRTFRGGEGGKTKNRLHCLSKRACEKVQTVQ